METEVQFDFRLGGGSSPVENVQAFASNHLKKVSSRYVRKEVEFDVVSIDESFGIPVTDMKKLDDDGERRNLHLVCRDWGFFQLINHGVADEVIGKMKIDLQEFFELPLEEKMAFGKTPDNPEGYGQDIRGSDLEDQKLEWKDILILVAQPMSLTNMRFWPTNPPSFRESFEKYTMALREVMIQLLKLIAENVGLIPETLSSFFEDGRQTIRMNYCPPCAEASKIMSNGEYKCIEHRVVVNEEEEPLSIASFHYPRRSTQIGPLPDVVKTNKAVYKMPLEELLTLRT
ncbi:Peroxidase superfamily protein [Hibiscus syriacus]|uniref:Peroxidase superfamily protein n=1 Tax=Hibiscus syriacus TaxID=106335 RepID=A0A6A2ZJ96_HIBSY|nr:Peroxidase superfamily protein [Hibiscus syriacus]